MPSNKKSTSGNGKNAISISYATIGAIGGILLIIGTLWGVVSKVATKADVDSIKASIAPMLTDHETRIRGVELQIARFFGASQTGAHLAPSDESGVIERTRYILAQYSPNAQQMPPAAAPAAPRIPPSNYRRVVVPAQMILIYNLQPTQGYSYALLGEDGRFYSLDDVLAVIIQMHLEERRAPQMKK